MAATEPAKPIRWRRFVHDDRGENGSISHGGETSHGYYSVDPAGDYGDHWEGRYHPDDYDPEPVKTSKSLAAVKRAAEHHHAATHYGLSGRDVKAVNDAWPDEGPARFIGKHPDMVRADLERAHGMSKSLRKAEVGAPPKLAWKRTPEGPDGELERWQAKGHHHYTVQSYKGTAADGSHPYSLIGSSTGRGATWEPIGDDGKQVTWAHRSREARRKTASSHPHSLIGHFKTHQDAQKAAEKHHIIGHHNLSDADVAATEAAWPDQGVHRFADAHSGRVKSDLERAHGMNKADFGEDASQGIGQPQPRQQLGAPEPTIGAGGDPILSDPKVKRFLQLLGSKMVEAQFGGAFKPGDRVIHPYLGLGKVIRVHDPAEADPQAGLLYDVRYPEFDIALNQLELQPVPPPPITPLAVPIKANMRSAIPTAPPHPALQALVSMGPNMGAVAQQQAEEKAAQAEAMAQGAGKEGGAEGEGGEGGDETPPKEESGGGSPFGG